MYFRVGVFAGIVCLFLLFFYPNFMLNAELKLRNLVVFLLSPVYYFRTARYVVETRSFFSTNYPLLSLFVCLLCEKCCTTIFVGRISIHCIYRRSGISPGLECYFNMFAVQTKKQHMFQLKNYPVRNIS